MCCVRTESDQYGGEQQAVVVMSENKSDQGAGGDPGEGEPCSASKRRRRRGERMSGNTEG
jgi:hypothetical protein